MGARKKIHISALSKIITKSLKHLKNLIRSGNLIKLISLIGN